ncbi:DUF397 domain-containing protein [Actinokineospora sp.]|uniref:DUF397 domain-containing protein n=1 Tax=Actinokineospora sp. TaxID=1872133 RepID=UPI00403838C5
MSTVVRDTGWFKSSFSNGGGDQCVECRIAVGTPVRVRDSKNPAAGSLRLPPAAWSAFVTTVAAV